MSRLCTSLPAYPKVKSWTSMCIGCSFEASPFVTTTADIFVCFRWNQYACLRITLASWSRINGLPGDTWWLLLSSSSSSWRPHAWRKWMICSVLRWTHARLKKTLFCKFEKPARKKFKTAAEDLSIRSVGHLKNYFKIIFSVELNDHEVHNKHDLTNMVQIESN